MSVHAIRLLSRAAVAVLMAATGLATAHVAAPASAGAACAPPSSKFLAGTVEGEDGRYVSAQVSVELFDSADRKLQMDGCVTTSSHYSAVTLVNEKPGTTCCYILPAAGSSSSPHNGYHLEKDWRVDGLPSNAAYAKIETYTKRLGSVSDTSRYGHSLRQVSVSDGNVRVVQPLRCGLGSEGDTGVLTGDLWDNGRRVTASRVSAFDIVADDGNGGRHRSFNVSHDHPTGGYRVDMLEPGLYSIFVTAGGKTTRFDKLRVERCATSEVDLAIRGTVPRTVGIPVGGDWDGDGDDEPGVWVNGRWILRSDAGPGGTTLPSYHYGSTPGDIPVVGDWDGDGDDEPAIYRDGTWHFRSDASAGGVTTHHVSYGNRPGDIPVAGDWDGDGDDEPGIYRPGEQWHFRSDAAPAGQTIWRATYGLQSTDVPVPGDWDGDGDDEPGIYRFGVWHARSTAGHDGRTYQTFTYGLSSGDVALSGNWDGDPGDEPAIYRRGDWHLRGSIGPQNTIYNYWFPS